MGDKKPNKKKTPKAKEIKEVPVSGPPGSSSSSSFIRKSNKRVKAPTRHRLYKGEYVIPTYYIGSAAGYTNYMAGTIKMGLRFVFQDLNWNP